MASLTRASEYDLKRLKDFIFGAGRLLILTGSGCSTRSRILDCRIADGGFKKKARKHVSHPEFMSNKGIRMRYWGRSLQEWHTFGQQQPNEVHHAIARLQKATALEPFIITQNVDRLHQKAGSTNVLQLYGSYASKVACTNPDCDEVMSRADFHLRIREINEDWMAKYIDSDPRPTADFQRLKVPDCTTCSGIIKPNIVFYGGPVPDKVTAKAQKLVKQSDAVLVIGATLETYNVFRHVKDAAELRIPVAVLNRGKNRADEILAFKVEASIPETLSAIVADLPELPKVEASTPETNSDIVADSLEAPEVEE